MKKTVHEQNLTEPMFSRLPKHRGVTVITPYGRALTFGVSKDRIERMLETVALYKNYEMTVSMQEHKAAKLNK
jgi:hypothetical protein